MPTQTDAHGKPLWFIDNLVHVHVTGEMSHEAYSLCEMTGAHGNMPPLHVHHRDDETFFVIDGQLTLYAGDREVVVDVGESVLAPRHVPHTYRVTSDGARWLVVNSPAGFERFVCSAAEPAPDALLPPPGRPVDPAALAQHAAEQGIEILGPPGALPDV